MLEIVRSDVFDGHSIIVVVGAVFGGFTLAIMLVGMINRVIDLVIDRRN